MENRFVYGNRIIAEFMGWSKNPIHGWLPPNKIDSWNHTSDEDLDFATSWDKLMPVVDRIESIKVTEPGCDTPVKFMVEIHHNGCKISRTWTTSQFKNFQWHQSGNKIKSVFDAVVEFIEWMHKPTE